MIGARDWRVIYTTHRELRGRRYRINIAKAEAPHELQWRVLVKHVMAPRQVWYEPIAGGFGECTDVPNGFLQARRFLAVYLEVEADNELVPLGHRQGSGGQ